MFRLLLLLCAALLVGFVRPGVGYAAEVGAQDLRPLARRLVAEVVRPAHAALSGAARAAAEGWEIECRAAAPSRDRLAERHRALARAWWFVEAVRFGPVGEDFRGERLSFWPDRRNATTRGLAALRDPAAPEPTPELVRAASAAVQGLPALERLIFDGRGGLDRRDCAIGRAIATNVAALTAEIDAGWTDLEAKIATDPEAARELVARLTTDLLTEFQVLIDVKLAPLGKSPDAARPDGLEGRRAGLERDALAHPLAGLLALARVLVDGREAGATVLFTLEGAAGVAEGLPASVGPLLGDPRRRSTVVLLRDALRSAQDTALADLPPLVGITVGFNSRDGD
ncbi:MAG: imelysin family protein [Siculibacillus sp.]|nr:imelysin family protein [Siculibacillus sp.]